MCASVAAAFALLAGCGSDTTQSSAAAATTTATTATAAATTTTNVPSEPTTSLFVVVPTTEPPPVVLSPDASGLLGLWHYKTVEGTDESLLDNLEQGFLRIEAPAGIGLSISNIRAVDPNDFVCGASVGSGGTLDVADGTLRITQEYETPAVECLAEIGPVPIVDAVGACLIGGCPYEVVDGLLRLSVSDGVTAVLDRL